MISGEGGNASAEKLNGGFMERMALEPDLEGFDRRNRGRDYNCECNLTFTKLATQLKTQPQESAGVTDCASHPC